MTTQAVSPGRWRLSAVRYLLGAVLLTTAGFKLFGMRVSAIPVMGWASSPGIQLATLQCELVIAVWLLSGYGQVGAWLAAVVMFAAFAGVSGFLSWAGETTCGCLGPVKASPRYVFGFDLTVLGALAFSLPNFGSVFRGADKPWKQLFRQSVAVVVGAGVIALLAGGVHLTFGSFEDALAWLRSESLSVSPLFLDLGDVRPGESRKASIAVRNRSQQPVHLLGGTLSGVWSVVEDLPLTVEPGETRGVTLRLKVPQSEPGILTYPVVFWTSDAAQREIRVNVACRVR